MWQPKVSAGLVKCHPPWESLPSLELSSVLSFLSSYCLLQKYKILFWPLTDYECLSIHLMAEDTTLSQFRFHTSGKMLCSTLSVAIQWPVQPWPAWSARDCSSLRLPAWPPQTRTARVRVSFLTPIQSIPWDLLFFRNLSILDLGPWVTLTDPQTLFFLCCTSKVARWIWLSLGFAGDPTYSSPETVNCRGPRWL